MEEETREEQFLLENFFKHNTEIAGWRNIALKLIREGKCLTTKQAIGAWKGGVGNFINTMDSDIGVGLVELTFDLADFCSSAFFIDVAKYAVLQIEEEIGEQNKKLSAIRNLSGL